MDYEARDACLRAVRLVARSARLCAVTDPTTAHYRTAVESSERMIDRAQSYYDKLRRGHAPTERQVRLVATAVTEARAIVSALTSGMALISDDLERLASKTERAIARCEAPPTDPPRGL